LTVKPLFTGSLLRASLVLLGEDGAPFLDPSKPTAYLIKGRSWVNNHAHVLRAKEGLRNRFLLHYLNQIDFSPYISGTTRAKLPQAPMKQIPIPLPSLEEQDRIVASIETQLSRLDEACAILSNLQAKLKQARASILKAAVEGRLVETEADLARKAGVTFEDSEILLIRCLEAKKKSFEDKATEKKTKKGWKSPPAPDSPLAFSLPAGWCLVAMEQIADVTGGLAKDSKLSDGEILPYLRVANVQRGRLDLAEVKNIICPSERIESLLLQKGDILLNEGGDRDKLGRGWVWNNQIERCIHQNHVFKARLACQDIKPEFISHYANTEGDRYFQQEGKQTTNLASISLSKVRSLPIALPPAAEQVRILAEVERRFSVLDQVEATVNASLRRCGQLQQAVLKRAFGG